MSRFAFEIWKPIKGFEGRFEISTRGRIKNLKFWTFQKTQLCQGYYHATIQANYKKRRTTVHRLMGETFLECPSGAKVIAHKNGKGTDNRIENLYWATFLENMLDKNKHGTMPKGDKSKRAKLKESEARLIHRLFREGGDPKALGKRFGVHAYTIEQIGTEQSWKHLWANTP